MNPEAASEEHDHYAGPLGTGNLDGGIVLAGDIFPDLHFACLSQTSFEKLPEQRPVPEETEKSEKTDPNKRP